MSSRKVRVKKLSVKTALPVLREDQIDPSEYEALATESQIATGVEQAEENEYHLQTILTAAGTSNDQEIPVPPPEENAIDYDDLYPSNFHQPSSYLRFSQTVEECISCQYDMTVEDDTFLRAYNGKKPPAGPLSEDEFEHIMDVFEETAAEQTPFASVDNTVVPYEHMVPGLTHLNSQSAMHHAKAIYEYWKTRRQEMGNKPIHPTLKFETHQEKDDTDPYVCFRRREARQTRKTRARDNKIAETLKRLRRELEDGRQLVILSAEREIMKRELLHADRVIFEERARLKVLKTKLGIKEGDEDLINQKPQKRKAPDAPVIQRPAVAIRMPVRPDGRTVDSDLVLLSDRLAEKENEFRADIELKVQNHRKWNANHIDLTRAPLSPISDSGMEQKFRPAKTECLLLTPPSSVSEEMDVDQEDAAEPESMQLDKRDPPILHFKSGRLGDDPESRFPSYRRRFGRGGRLWIDRRGLESRRSKGDNQYSDRWRFDSDSEDDEPDVYEVDQFDTRALKFRASIPLSQFMFSRRPAEMAHGVPLGAASHGPRGLPSAQQVSGQGAQTMQAAQAAQATQTAAQVQGIAHGAQASPVPSGVQAAKSTPATQATAA